MCRGIEVDRDETNAFAVCDRDTDQVQSNGAYDGTCAYTDACVETGSQTRTNPVCENGVEVDRDETTVLADRNRDTDATVLFEGQYGACAYGDACIETGTKTRTNSVCVGGVATDQNEDSQDGCDRDFTG